MAMYIRILTRGITCQTCYSLTSLPRYVFERQKISNFIDKNRLDSHTAFLSMVTLIQVIARKWRAVILKAQADFLGATLSLFRMGYAQTMPKLSAPAERTVIQISP